METRHIVAYALLAVLAVAALWLGLWFAETRRRRKRRRHRSRFH